MLNPVAYIEELILLSKDNLRICRMNWWLLKYENEFTEAIDKTRCEKWRKWYYNDIHPFQCLCPQKEKLCEFIDIYRELDRLTQIQRDEKYFERMYKKYLNLNENHLAIKNWMNEIRPKITSIYLNLDKNKNLRLSFYNAIPKFELNINKNDYKYTLECLSIFSHVTYVMGY